ncbi:hypothetical protein [Microlunatus soli]|uniref:DUF4287 domain-containing protein n=1 Tax=Microlunatus soli TaxID=630515 RepID=A0A1H1PYY8_9ACTN|nr:hypothetical protein [Microlunatus soli]SDS15929.1 hypothetical protein SAMN04489812_1062 [Microlunatus soli]
MNASKRSKALVAASGRDYPEWFDLLDRWGASGRPYAEISDWLTGQGLSSWWAQKLIIEYEQARGVRRAGARPDGSYTAGASKTIAADAEQVFAAFVEPLTRASQDRDSQDRDSWLHGISVHGRVLPTPTLTERTTTAPRSAHFDIDGGPRRLHLTIAASGPGKVTVAVEESGLDDPETVEPTKQAWRLRLDRLKQIVQSHQV